jgi:hypothetical protein
MDKVQKQDSSKLVFHQFDSVELRMFVLMSWSSIPVEKLIVASDIQKFLSFCETRRQSLSCVKPIQLTSSHNISLRSALILSTDLHLGLLTFRFRSGFPTKM